MAISKERIVLLLGPGNPGSAVLSFWAGAIPVQRTGPVAWWQSPGHEASVTADHIVSELATLQETINTIADPLVAVFAADPSRSLLAL